MINANPGLLKIFVAAGIDIGKFLRVAVGEGEPAALDLYHDPVSLFESMRQVGHRKFYRFSFFRFEGYWLFKTVSEFTPEYITTHEHLIATERVYSFRFLNRIDVDTLKGKAVREYVDQFYHKISIGGADAAMQFGCQRSAHRKVF